MKKIIGILCCLTLIVNAKNSSEFVVKKNKRVSVARLKERCCQDFSQVLKEIPQTLRSIAKNSNNTQLLDIVADLQDCAVLAIEGYVEGNKKGFCALATKEQLECAHGKLNRASELLRKPSGAQSKELKEIVAYFRV